MSLSYAFDLVRYPPYSKLNLNIFLVAAKLPDLPSITGNTFCLGLLLAVSTGIAVSYFEIFSLLKSFI